MGWLILHIGRRGGGRGRCHAPSGGRPRRKRARKHRTQASKHIAPDPIAVISSRVVMSCTLTHSLERAAGHDQEHGVLQQQEGAQRQRPRGPASAPFSRHGVGESCGGLVSAGVRPVEQTDAPPSEREGCLPPMPLGGGGRGQCRSGLRSAGRSRSSSSNRGR